MIAQYSMTQVEIKTKIYSIITSLSNYYENINISNPTYKCLEIDLSIKKLCLI